MTQQSFCDLRTLLVNGRPDSVPVAVDGVAIIRWERLRDEISSRRAQERGTRRRVLVAEDSPLAFLATLLAALADGDVPVLPPNFQPDTLRSLAELPAPTDVPPSTLELYTSGSSGEPKRILKGLDQLAAECRVQEQCWGEMIGAATVIATTPYHHIYGLLFRLLWPLCAGRVFDSATITDPAMLFHRLASLDRTALVSSPAHLSRLPAEAPKAAVTAPSIVFSSGGALMAEAAGRVEKLWAQAPVEIYGSTESGGIAWRRQTEGASWTPLPQVSVEVAPDGALMVRSPFIEEPTALRMEDMAELMGDGRFTLSGRLDRIIKIEEKRLSMPEMEAWLASHDAVAACAVAPVMVGARTVVGAVVVSPPDSLHTRRALIDSLTEHLRLKFEPVLLPRRWRFVEQLPYNERGKLTINNLVSLLNTPL